MYRNIDIQLSKLVKKQLLKVPMHIRDALFAWVEDVEEDGLLEVRKISGYHDEPLKFDRKGQRSIRLSRSYRAIYEVMYVGDKEIIVIREVSKHDY
ncbi:MAG: hypothetical protein HYU97_10230 [Deltaproteobacteria bacterium]|nr:hypothetical protein [Deltaproteobacteria bacterium]